MKRFLLAAAVLLAVNTAIAQKKADPAANATTAMKTYIDGLMKRMTLEEKIGQLNLPSSGDITTGQAKSSDIGNKIKAGQVGGLFNIKGVEKIREVQRIAVEESRLKIPLIFAMDVIHGYQTTFPIPLGLSCTWNMKAIESSARIAANEATSDGICWTFSPMVDISRDARWGRISEGSGEDPYLGGEIAKAMVNGYQGDNLALNNTMMACVKHYALYGAAEAGRDYNTVDMSRERMFNDYMYPYQAAVDAGVGSVMASFNTVEGIPATGSKFLQTDVLRKMWSFKGFVVTDYTGINEMIAHGMGDLQQVSALALNAGIDMDMVGEGFLTTLKKSLQEGKVKMVDIDRACRLILEAKYKLGLFSDPYRYMDVQRSKNEIFTKQNRAAARNIAAESLVLLKNNNNLLPLKKSGTIGIIGPLGNDRANMPGTWSVATDLTKPVTLLEGMKEVAGSGVNILYSRGSRLFYDSLLEKRGTMFGREIAYADADSIMWQSAMDVAAKSDVIIAAMGEPSELSGESSSRTNLDLPDAQKDLLKALVKTGKPVVLVLFTGRPLTLTWEDEHVPAILNAWFAGTEAGHAIADVLFGEVNPSGKLTTTFPQNVGQLPLYYSLKPTGRPLGKWFEKFRSNYLDVSNDPLYPFGYGLSYSNFSYGGVKLNSASMTKTGSVIASVTVTNNSSVAGQEVVQLYLRDMVASISRPVKELKGFEKISLAPGETKTVSFKIDNEMLKFYTNDLKHISEPGEFKVMIGSNSRDVKEATFTLK